ncbi:hypothetical protein C0992_002030 [Termitomyces sp. T32_za158]|nr:hypothetical protein C0992_002030 [Termitomyces sp. T32_za158]
MALLRRRETARTHRIRCIRHHLTLQPPLIPRPYPHDPVPFTDAEDTRPHARGNIRPRLGPRSVHVSVDDSPSGERSVKSGDTFLSGLVDDGEGDDYLFVTPPAMAVPTTEIPDVLTAVGAGS